jgi:hypothetical protein
MRLVVPYLSGVRVTTLTPVVSLGVMAGGQTVTIPITLANLGKTEAVISGAMGSCSCIAYRGLPSELPPRGRTTVNVDLHVPAAAGHFTQKVVFFVQCDGGLLQTSIIIAGSSQAQHHGDVAA